MPDVPAKCPATDLENGGTFEALPASIARYLFLRGLTATPRHTTAKFDEGHA
jgi:hypothetical protein